MFSHAEHAQNLVGCCLATIGVKGLLWPNRWVWLAESWPVGLLGNIQQNSYMTLIGGAFDHASHAPQLRSCNYYVHVHIHVQSCMCT